MELECAKYGEKMTPEQARCRHLEDYCKYRTSCIIYFLEQDRKGGSGRREEHAAGAEKDSDD